MKPDVLLTIDLDKFVLGVRNTKAIGLEHAILTPAVGNAATPVTWTTTEITGLAFNCNLWPTGQNDTGTVTATVSGVAAGAVRVPNLDGVLEWQSLTQNPVPFTLEVKLDLVWHGRQPTNQMVGAPVDGLAPEDEAPAKNSVQRPRMEPRISWTDHPAKAFEPDLDELKPGGVRPNSMPYAVWVEEYAFRRDQNRHFVVQTPNGNYDPPTKWISDPPPFGLAEIENLVTNAVANGLGEILALPGSLAEQYGRLGMSFMGLLLDRHLAHVVGMPWTPPAPDPSDNPGPWLALLDLDGETIPGAITADMRMHLSPNLLKRSVRFSFEVADLMDEVIDNVSELDISGISFQIPEVHSDDGMLIWPARAALGEGFAEWLRRKLVDDGVARKEDVAGELIVPFMATLDQSEGHIAADSSSLPTLRYARSFLNEARADVWALDGEVSVDFAEDPDIALNEPNVRFVDPDDRPVLFPALLPGEHAVIRARMTWDSLLADGHVHLYFNFAVGPFLDFVADVKQKVSDPNFVIPVNLGALGLDTLARIFNGVWAFLGGDSRAPLVTEEVRERVEDNVEGGVGAAEEGADDNDPTQGVRGLGDSADISPTWAATLAAHLTGLRASDLFRTPNLILRDGIYSADTGMTLEVAVDQGGLPIQSADPEVREHAAGDGILAPLRVVTGVESHVEGTLVLVKNRWDRGGWASVNITCVLSPAFTVQYFRMIPNQTVPLIFLGADAATLRVEVQRGSLRLAGAAEGLELTHDDFDPAHGAALWAVRIQDSEGTERWIVGVSSEPRRPITTRAEARKLEAARAEATVFQDVAAVAIRDEWDRLSQRQISAIRFGTEAEVALAKELTPLLTPLARIYLVDPFDLESESPEGLALGVVVLRLPVGVLAGTGFETLPTLDDQVHLAKTRRILVKYLVDFGVDLAKDLSKSYSHAKDETDDATDADYAFKDEIQPAIDRAKDLARGHFDARVPDDYDSLARPEHTLRSVPPRLPGRAVRLTHDQFSATSLEAEPIPYPDALSTRVYWVLRDWSFTFRLTSRGFPPTTRFAVELWTGVTRIASTMVQSVDLDGIGVVPGPKRQTTLVQEITSDAVVMNFSLPDSAFINEPDQGRVVVGVKVTVAGALVAEEQKSLHVVLRRTEEISDLGRYILNEMAGADDAPDWGSFGEPGQGRWNRRAWSPMFALQQDNQAGLTIHNPAVDDLLGNLRRKGPVGPPVPRPRPRNPASDDLIGRVTRDGRVFGPQHVAVTAEALRRWIDIRMPRFALRALRREPVDE